MQQNEKTGFSIAAAWAGVAGLLYLLVLQLLYWAAVRLKPFHTAGGLSFLSALVSGLALAVTAAILLWLSPVRCPQLRLGRSRLWRPSLFLPVFLFFIELSNFLAAFVRQAAGTQASNPELPQGGMALFWQLICLCVVPALGEELLFRGVVQGLLRPYGGWMAIVGQAVIFALLHQELSQCLVALLCALYFGWVAQVTGSIRTGVLLHLVNNGISVLQNYAYSYGSAALADRLMAFSLLLFPVLAGWALWRARREGLLPRLRLPAGRFGPWALLAAPGYLLSVLALAALCVVRNFG